MDLGRNNDSTHPPLPPGHVSEWESLAVDYLDGRLDLAEEARVEAHLAGCASCRAELDQQRGVSVLLRGIEHPTAPAHIEAAVMAAIAAAAAPEIVRSPGVERPPWHTRLFDGLVRRPWLPAIAATLLVVVALAQWSEFGDANLQSDRESLTVTTVAAGQPPAARSDEGPSGGEQSTPGDSSSNATTDQADATAPTAEIAGTDSTVVALGETSSTTLGPPAPDANVAGVATTEPASNAMIAAAAAPEPRWVTYVAPSPADAGAAAATVEATTGLSPLPAAQSLGGPTFAAMIARSELDLIVQSLQDAGLTLVVLVQPSLSFDQAAMNQILNSPVSAFLLIRGTETGDVSSPARTAGEPAPEDLVLMVLAPAD